MVPMPPTTTEPTGPMNAATAPLTRMPSARNGIAWTKMPQNTVAAVAISGVPATKLRRNEPASASPTTTATSTCIDPRRVRRGCASTATAAIVPAGTIWRADPDSRFAS